MTRAILTDIEGTTSSLSFVKDTLFPYSRERLADFVKIHRRESEVARLLDDARGIAGADLTEEELVQTLIQWIDDDKKITPLKTLQGLIWKAGYERGDFTGHIYPDACQALRSWRDRGLRLYVFSSGSVKAQQLLFSYSDEGDLTPLFDGYFDTTIGAKRESQAYRTIAEQIHIPPPEVLFLSDIKEELDAARTAGMQTCWLIRSGERPSGSEHPIARNFAEIAV